MNVRKKPILFSVIFGFVICFGLITSNDVFAVSDLTTVLNASNYTSYQNQALFPTCNDTQCLSQYHYLSLSYTGNVSTATNFVFKGLRGFNDLRVYVDTVYKIDGSTSLEIPSMYIYGTQEYTFTLSENPPSQACPPPSGSLTISANGTYDVSEYGSVDVNVPTGEDSRFMGVVIDSFWQYHVAFASACVGIIVIFLVYRLIKGRLR